jgi:hypothetical protein
MDSVQNNALTLPIGLDDHHSDLRVHAEISKDLRSHSRETANKKPGHSDRVSSVHVCRDCSALMPSNSDSWKGQNPLSGNFAEARRN